MIVILEPTRLGLALSIKGPLGEGFQRERVALGYNVFPVVSKKAFPRSHVGLSRANCTLSARTTERATCTF